MAIVIQAQTGCVNVLNSDNPVGEQIIYTVSTDCVAKLVKKTAPLDDIIQILDDKGKPTASVRVTADLELQDEGGAASVWVGTNDELLNKLNNEYFVGAAASPGGGDASEAKQQELIDLTDEFKDDVNEGIDLGRVKEQRFYFNLEDVEQKANVPVFPLTCELRAEDGAIFEAVPSATYSNIDALIFAFNAGITRYILEKRTDTSFYVLDNASVVSITEEKVISFNTGFFPARVYRFFTLNKGSYPIVSVQDEILEQQEIQNGTGLISGKVYTDPQGVIFYNWKSFSLDVESIDADNKIRVEFLNETFDSLTFPYTRANGEIVTGIEFLPNSVQKTPIKVTNLGAATNSVTILTTY